MAFDQSGGGVSTPARASMRKGVCVVGEERVEREGRGEKVSLRQTDMNKRVENVNNSERKTEIKKDRKIRKK